MEKKQGPIFYIFFSCSSGAMPLFDSWDIMKSVSKVSQKLSELRP